MPLTQEERRKKVLLRRLFTAKVRKMATLMASRKKGYPMSVADQATADQLLSELGSSVPANPEMYKNGSALFRAASSAMKASMKSNPALLPEYVEQVRQLKRGDGERIGAVVVVIGHGTTRLEDILTATEMENVSIISSVPVGVCEYIYQSEDRPVEDKLLDIINAETAGGRPLYVRNLFSKRYGLKNFLISQRQQRIIDSLAEPREGSHLFFQTVERGTITSTLFGHEFPNTTFSGRDADVKLQKHFSLFCTYSSRDFNPIKPDGTRMYPYWDDVDPVNWFIDKDVNPRTPTKRISLRDIISDYNEKCRQTGFHGKLLIFTRTCLKVEDCELVEGRPGSVCNSKTGEILTAVKRGERIVFVDQDGKEVDVTRGWGAQSLLKTRDDESRERLPREARSSAYHELLEEYTGRAKAFDARAAARGASQSSMGDAKLDARAAVQSSMGGKIKKRKQTRKKNKIKT
jgi:hypothetical protein